MMYFTGRPSLHRRTDALTCAFGSFPGASQGHPTSLIHVSLCLGNVSEPELWDTCIPDIFQFSQVSLLRDWLDRDTIIFHLEHLYFCYGRCVPWSCSDLKAGQHQDRHTVILLD